MSKRNQVFVSSTFDDLQEERRQVTWALLAMDCIPSGMELFSAANADQWTVITRMIDDCDYYILILAGRYGSTDDKGISYTEKEFDYADEKGKPIIAFLHGNPGIIPGDKLERDARSRKKLEAFRDKVKRRLIQYWTSPEELTVRVSTSLHNLFNSNPTSGWVRAESISIPAILGLDIGDKALGAFRRGGDATRIEGTWMVDWSAFDKTGKLKPWEVASPDDPSGTIPYPTEEIEVSANGSLMFCTARKPIVREETVYWLAGRVSHNNEVSLLYWNADNLMNGCVFLNIVDNWPQPLELRGSWLGNASNHDLIHGNVTWKKSRR
jgi:hypothetical protein